MKAIALNPVVAGYGAIALVGVVALFWILNGGARKTAAAAGAVPGELVAGVAEGFGESLGIPRTNADECEQALRDGRLWDASFKCPAGRFLGRVFGGGEAPTPLDLNADTSGGTNIRRQ